jgi:hypothetical protein
MRLFRRLVLAFLIVFVVVGIGFFVAARYYLCSPAMATEASARLQALLGAPVEVDAADVGMTGSSSLRGLRIFEPGDEAKQAPVLAADGATADVAAADLMAGKSPTAITLTGVSIALHFDAEGNLLTHLPIPTPGAGLAPRLHVESGKLTINQDGRAPMVVRGIQVDLGPDGKDMRAAGSVADPFWGDWTLDGRLASAAGTVTLTLSGKDVTVDKARLNGLPFVAPAVWQEVMGEGKTSCDFTLRLTGQDRPTIHYRVACTPLDARVNVASIELDADHANGQIIVDDNIVRLRGVHGRFASGEIQTDADLDFGGPSWRLQFPQIEARNVVVHELPRLWIQSLKDKIDGELNGKADVHVTLDEGRVHVSGSGDGEIDKATVAGFPAREPIQLALVTEDGRLRIRSRESVGKIAMAVLTPATVAGPPAPAPTPSPPAFPKLTAPAVLTWLPSAAAWATNRGADVLCTGLSTAAGWFGPTRPGAPQETSYLTAKLTLEDVDLGELLRRLEVKLPFPVEGKLSFQVETGIPINTPQDMKAYRLDGTADLPRLNVAGVEMADVHTRIRYDNGILEMQELKGKAIPAQSGPEKAGRFEGTARMEVAPLGELSGNLKVDRFPLDVVLTRLPEQGALRTARSPAASRPARRPRP